MHGLVYPRNKIDWSSECYNIKCPRTQMLQRSEKENHKNYLEKGTIDLGSEPSKFKYKEAMIHKNLCI